MKTARPILAALLGLALALSPGPAGAHDVDGPAVPGAVHPPRIPVVAVRVPPEAGRGVVVVATPGAQGAAAALAERLPQERADLARLLGMPDAGPTEIRVGSGRDEFQSLQPAGRVPSWAAGVAYPAMGLVVLDVAASSRVGNPAQVLRHELAHVALGRLAPSGVPRWFTEGFAQVHAGEWSLERSTTLARAAASGSLIDLDDLERRFPSSPTEVDLAYAQSASAVSFLAGIEEGAALHRLFGRLAAGEGFHDALAASFGQPLVGIEIDWKRKVQSRYGWVALIFDESIVLAAGGLLVIVAAFRVRRRRRRRMEELGRREEAEAEARAALARRAFLEAQSGRSA